MASLVLSFDRKSWDVQTKMKARVPIIPSVVFLIVFLFCVTAVAIVEKSLYGAAVALLGADLGIIFLLSTFQQKDHSSEIFVNSTSQHRKVRINISTFLRQSMSMFSLSLVSLLSAEIMEEKNIVFGAWLLIMTARIIVTIARTWLPKDIVNSTEFQWISSLVETKFRNSDAEEAYRNGVESVCERQLDRYCVEPVSETESQLDDDDWEDLSTVTEL